jgi:broad specificity phosphatase PhoE
MRLVLIRHSKSCANYVRAVADTEDHTDLLVRASQDLRDPPLSAVGERMARAYGPRFRDRLREAGFDLQGAVIGSSQLRRAKQTAALLFGDADRITVPHFTENGAIPENTPARMRYRRPDWTTFVRHLSTILSKNGEYIIVGHGSFLKGVWRQLTGSPWPGTFHNLDAFIVEPDGRTRVLRYSGDVSPSAPDQCALPAKIATHVKMRQRSSKRSSRRQTKKRSSRQRGGATPMPLGYYKDGAQMQYTSADPTGAAYGATTNAWVRAPIQQTGGFYPSIMGGFASNGMKILPSLAVFAGYNQWKNQAKSRGTRRNRH